MRIGLVDRVLPDAGLWDATMELARTISGNAPLAIKAAKITIAEVLKDESHREIGDQGDRHRLHGLEDSARAAPRSWKSASRVHWQIGRDDHHAKPVEIPPRDRLC